MNRTTGALALVLAATLIAPAPADARGARRKGEIVEVTGKVVDADGAPIAGATVALEASRGGYDLLRLRRRDDPPVRLPATTGDDGDFAITWSWDKRHDTFTIVAGAMAEPATPGAANELEVFARYDVTAAMLAGGPVSALVTVPDGSVLRWLLRYARDGGSADQRKVFEELGRPDRVDRADRRHGAEESWWYFEHGKVYRFLDRGLEQVVHFDPVLPIE